jgi:hypothetical protein
MTHIARPDCEKASAFEAVPCTDPNCGLHLIALRRDDTPICEIVVSREALHGLLEIIHDEGLDL